MITDTKNDIRPDAVMSEDDLRAWEALSPAEQLDRLREAIAKGIASRVNGSTMDQIWRRIEARRHDAEL